MCSYLKAIHTLSPSGLSTSPPHRSGLDTGISTRMRRKRVWSELKTVLSISNIVPRPFSMSRATTSLSNSKGRPQTWTHKGIWVKQMLRGVISLIHFLSTSIWLSKLQGPLSSTHFSWFSNLNRNWSSSLPTLTIFRSAKLPYWTQERFRSSDVYRFIHKESTKRLRAHSSNVWVQWS